MAKNKKECVIKIKLALETRARLMTSTSSAMLQIHIYCGNASLESLWKQSLIT